MRGYRPLEARLAGQTEHAPWPSPRPAPAKADLRAAEREIQAAVQSGAPGALADDGVWHVARGRLDEAVGELENATALAPREAWIGNDLAAALLARSPATGFVDAVRALERCERALYLDPRLSEAAFNRALALERLSLAAPAVTAWEEFLQMEPSRSWARLGLVLSNRS